MYIAPVYYMYIICILHVYYLYIMCIGNNIFLKQNNLVIVLEDTDFTINTD